MAKTLAKEKIETMKFKEGPLAGLVWELEVEAQEWCKKNCPYRGGFLFRFIFPSDGLPCFENPVYYPEFIEKCKKIPKLYKLYWKAKSESISAIFPLIVYKEENDQAKKG